MTDTGKIEKMRELHSLFRKSLAYMDRRFRGHILPDGSRRYNPDLERDIHDFHEKAEKPMEDLWASMSGQERNATGI